MSNFYVKVNSNRIVVAVMDLGAEYTKNNYYPIDEYNTDLLGTQLAPGILPGTPVTIGDFEENPDIADVDNDGISVLSSGTSSCCLWFPETIVKTYNVNLKGNRMTVYNTDSSSFWSYFAYGGTYEYWDATTRYFTNNTSNQTIVDIEGQGVLTNVICPVPNSWNSTVTVIVTVDGVENVFVSRSNDTVSRYCLGFLAPEYDSSDDDDDHIQYPSANWREEDREMFVLIPPTALSRGRSGIKFNSSLKVDVKSSSGWQYGNDSIGGVSYLTYIPFGL
jgi:hypothetical protein